MSINALTNSAAARRPDFAPFGTPPQGLSEIALAAGSMLPHVSSESMPAPAEVPLPGQPGGTSSSLQAQSANAINTAMHLLFGYIPTEIITLYVAILAAMEPPKGQRNPNQIVIFYVFLFATPCVVWLVYAAKLKGANKSLPLPWRAWPVWEMIAGTVAYCAWALALPTNPLQIRGVGWYSPSVAGIFELSASTLLGLLAPFFQRPLGM